MSYQIEGLENGTEYFVRVAAYNGPGGENASSDAQEAFTTYGAPADASPFPVASIEQVSAATGCNARSHQASEFKQ